MGLDFNCEVNACRPLLSTPARTKTNSISIPEIKFGRKINSIASDSSSLMNKHRIRRPFRYEYIPGKYGGLTPEEKEWRVWEEMDREETGYEELVERLQGVNRETAPDEDERRRDAADHPRRRP